MSAGASPFPVTPIGPALPGTRILGDLHLDPFREESAGPFVEWLEGLGDCPRVVVLGDLFDFWTGANLVAAPGARAVFAGMAGCVQRGARVELLHGNRDFLLDRAVERAALATVHPGPVLLEGDGPVLVAHGDEFCTRDHAYQRLRRVLRSAPGRALARALPGPVATSIARRLRRRSVRAVAAKPAEAKAMQAPAVAAAAARCGAATVVCGHAHVWRDSVLEGGSPRWIVLDGWGGERDVLRLDGTAGWVGESSRS